MKKTYFRGRQEPQFWTCSFGNAFRHKSGGWWLNLCLKFRGDVFNVDTNLKIISLWMIFKNMN